MATYKNGWGKDETMTSLFEFGFTHTRPELKRGIKKHLNVGGGDLYRPAYAEYVEEEYYFRDAEYEGRLEVHLPLTHGLAKIRQGCEESMHTIYCLFPPSEFFLEVINLPERRRDYLVYTIRIWWNNERLVIPTKVNLPDNAWIEQVPA